jgi:CheY-like chemotaxis protein
VRVALAAGALMSVEGAFEAESGKSFGAATRSARDARSLVSTRLTRELIAADARSDLDGDDPPARTSRLLGVALASLSAQVGAVLRYEAAPRTPSCLATDRVAPAAVELLEGQAGIGSLAQRACAERRLFVLEQASREPLMSCLRVAEPEIAIAAVVPLYDRGVPVAALLLAARDARVLQPSSLRLLTPAFHLLGVLLSPGRIGSGAPRSDAQGETAEQERYVVEIEELGNLLHEARLAARTASEAVASAEAEARAEIESYRARIAALEASASGSEVERSLRLDVESDLAAQARRIEAGERRIRELEEENLQLQMRLAALDTVDAERSSSTTPIGVATSPGDDIGLEEMADAAIAALSAGEKTAEVSGPARADELDDETPDLVVDDEELEAADAPQGQEEAADLRGPEQAPETAGALPLVLLAIEGDAEVRSGILAAADRVAATAWVGDGELPGGRGLLAANLFDPMLVRVPELLTGGKAESDGLAYGRDPESGLGFEIGAVSWLPRPFDTAAAAARVRRMVAGKTGGIVIISRQLRELAPLRDALSANGVSSSVACDARQAVDLLEIVRCPDALLIDLALDGGQGLTVAVHCRSESATRDVPLFLLLEENPDPARLLAAARRTTALTPFGAHEVARMITASFARR